MDIPRQETTDADPIVQLTDMPTVPPPMPYSHPQINRPPSEFDKAKLILPLSILIAAVLVSSSILYAQRGTAPVAGIPTGATPKPISKVDIDLTNAMVLGDANAPVTVVEYGDYQCPFCQRYFQQNQLAIVSQYVNSGKVRFVWKDYAFLGQESIWASEAARCANDQGKFWAYHDHLYTHQGAENSGAFSKANLKKFAIAVGLNANQFNTCLDSGKYTALIQQETQAASAIGVTGTPATFVNGLLVADSNGNSVGAAPFATFKTLIDQILAK